MRDTKPKAFAPSLQDIPNDALILRNYPLQSLAHCWYRMSQLAEV